MWIAISSRWRRGKNLKEARSWAGAPVDNLVPFYNQENSSSRRVTPYKWDRMVWVSGEGYGPACNSSTDQKWMGTPQHGGFAKSMLLIWQPWSPSSAGSDNSGFSGRQNHSFIESCMGSQWFRLPPAACGPQPMPTQVNRNLLVDFKEHWLGLYLSAFECN